MSEQQGATSSAQRVVLFDFDGVLIRGDAFGLLIRERYRRGWWRKAVVLLISPCLLLILPFAWRRALHTLVRVGLLGMGEARYRAVAKDSADALVHRPGQFRREAVRSLRRHVAQGDRVIIVTGCEDTLVRAMLEALGLDGVEILASRLRGGRLGMRMAWHNIGNHKVEALAQHGIEAWQVAYSDSTQDLPMLALATEPVLVNGTPKLCKRIEKALGRSVRRVTWN